MAFLLDRLIFDALYDSRKLSLLLWTLAESESVQLLRYSVTIILHVFKVISNFGMLNGIGFCIYEPSL